MDSLQSKNDYVLYRSMYNEELHTSIIDKDVEAIERVLDQLSRVHLKVYDFSLYDSNTEIDIDYVLAEHKRDLNICR